MTSIDSQNYSPLLEKRNFKDMLEDDILAVEEDLITKIFSQTVQVSPSEEGPAEPYAHSTFVDAPKQETIPDAAAKEFLVIVESAENQDVDSHTVDKVPIDLSHFNQTIEDNGEEDAGLLGPLYSEEITIAATDCVDEIMEELQERLELQNVTTPSTASPVDYEGNINFDDHSDSEIRVFEEIERITEVSPEKKVVHLLMEEEPTIAQEGVERASDIEYSLEVTYDDDDVDCYSRDSVVALKQQLKTTDKQQQYSEEQGELDKSSFSKFDALQKKAAAAAAAAQPHVNGSAGVGPGILGQEQNSVRCTACDKVVYQMEQMKAENRFWHKNCFRCTTCNKPMAVDSYQSHESILYCKPHFKQLFSPKTVLDSDDIGATEKRGPEMIIRESQPTALPVGVVRATDKVEDGLTLDDLHRLKNVKQAFEMFEKQQDSESHTVELSTHKVEKSPSIINKLAQFQKKISREANRTRKKGVPANDLNGEPVDGNVSNSSSCYSSEDDAPPEGVDVDLWQSRKATNKSDPIQHCTDLDDLRSKFESNDAENERRGRQEERREEIKRIRSRLFMGKQAKIKEQYQQAVADSEFVVEHQSGSRRAGEAAPGNIKNKMQQLGEGGDEQAINTTKQKLLDMKSENLIELEELRRQKQHDNLEIKSKFESGIENSPSYNRGADDPELMAQMVEKGIAKMSRNIFLEIDKQAAQQTGPKSPIALQTTNLRKSASMVQQSPPAEVVNKTTNNGSEEENGVHGVVIDTKDLQKKFAFFEKYQEQDRSPKKTINVTKFKDTSAVKEMFENNQLQSNNRRQESFNEDVVVVESNTTKKMLSLFRDIESGANKQQFTDGRRPLKTFTPPPEDGRRFYDADGDENGNQGNDDSDPGVTDNSDIESEDEEALKKRIGKYDDEILERAKKEARAQKLRAKFERWETEQIRMEQDTAADQGRREYLDPTQLESATNLRDKFEFMSKGDSQNNSPRKVMVNRFV